MEKSVDIHQRRVGFRFNSVRTLLGLSLFEFSRLLNRSHYTLSAIERSIRYPADDLTYAIIELAALHHITLSSHWLMGEEGAPWPTSTDSVLQQKITIESYIEACLIYCDDPEHRKKFGQRLSILLKNMVFSPLKFARWGHVSVGTVHQWLSGNSMPKREAMRFMIDKIKRESIPLALEWLCLGRGVLEPFQYVVPLDHDDQKNEAVVHVKIDSSEFEPYISRNTKISAYPYSSSFFITNWAWFYLYCYHDQWIPVQLESTKQLDVFHVMSLHNKISDRILLKDVQCDFIYPIIYLEKTYPVKLKIAN